MVNYSTHNPSINYKYYLSFILIFNFVILAHFGV